MKFKIIFLFLFYTIGFFSSLTAEKEIWYKEVFFKPNSEELEDNGLIIYKKYSWREKDNKALIKECFYFKYPDANTEETETLRVYLESETNTLLENEKYIYQKVTRHISKNNLIYESIKAQVENDEVIYYRDESGKYNLYKKPVVNKTEIYFALSGKIPPHPSIYKEGESFDIQVLNVMMGRVNSVTVTVLPKSTIPDSKSEYFVVRVFPKGAPEKFEEVYYDSNGRVVYKKRKGSITMRINKPKLEIIQPYQPIHDIDQSVAVHQGSSYYYSYPISWKTMDAIFPFDSMYSSNIGTAGVIIMDKRFGDLDTLTANVLSKLQSTRNGQPYFTDIITPKNRKIKLRKHSCIETLVKVKDNETIKYFLILTVIHNKQAYAIVVFGEEDQYHQNWPTWFNFAHSFSPVDPE